MLILALALLPSLTNAIPLKEIPPLHIYMIEELGDFGYSEEAGLEVAMFAIAELNQHMNLHVIVSGYEIRYQPISSRVGITDEARHYQLEQYESEIEYRKDIVGDMVLVLSPPLFNGYGDFYLAGLSSTICRWAGSAFGYHGKRISIANIEPINSEGLDRRKESITDIQHEILHLLGADHVGSMHPEIMDPAAMQFAAQFPAGEMPIFETSKEDVRVCFDSPRARRKFHLPKKQYNEFTGKKGLMTKMDKIFK